MFGSADVRRTLSASSDGINHFSHTVGPFVCRSGLEESVRMSQASKETHHNLLLKFVFRNAEFDRLAHLTRQTADRLDWQQAKNFPPLKFVLTQHSRR